MKSAPDETATDWKHRWPAYLATVGAVLLIGAIIILSASRMSRRAPPEPTAPAAGFSSEWKCIDAGAKGGGFCWRDLPPAKPRQTSR